MMRAGFQGRGGLSAPALTGIVFLVALSCSVVTFARDKAKSVPGEYVVTLTRPVRGQSLEQLSIMVDAQVVSKIRDDVLLIRRAAGESDQRLVTGLRAQPEVKRVEPNYIYDLVRVPNDPDYSKLWGLNNGGGLDSDGTRGLKQVDIGAERAWELSTGSRDVVVAVIDTGFDYNHVDLAPNAWVNRKEAEGKAGVDDDGNGFVDDIHGYDFTNNDGDPMDDQGHGTHCAGTIGASGDNNTGVVGVNWKTSIMGVKFLNANGSGTLADAIRAIDYATQMKVDIMSNSWGGGGRSEALLEAIQRASEAGILFVAAAGNESSDNDKRPSYPATYDVDNVLSVAAIDIRGDLAYFSNYGEKTVHVAAPGHNILSTIPGGTETLSGTSMATPHVSGVAALLLSHVPSLGYQELKARIMRTAKPLAALKGRIATGGLVDAYHALSDTLAPPDPNDPSLWSGRESYALSSPHPYENNFEQTYTITLSGAERIAVHFSKFETESGYDKVKFFNANNESLGSWSGNRNDRISPVADGDTIILKFKTDNSTTGYGFDIDSIIFE